MGNPKVLVVGSAEKSGGGVSSVIKLMKKMPIWNKYSCYWLGTQIQAGTWTKLWYVVKSYFIAFFIVWRYDIVHFHTVPNVSMKIQLPIYLLARMWRKKIIIHLHCGNQLLWDKYINFRLAHWCMNHADKIILLSNKFKDYLDEYWKDVKTSRIVIYNACEGVYALPYDQHEKYILMAGSIDWNKSCDTLVWAFSMIHEEFPEWKVILLGSGPEENKIKEIVQKCNISGKILMPGYLYGEEVRGYFQKAGIYCMCSNVEGFPMVVLEAWSYGVPVITTPVGGLPDVIDEGKNCLTFYDYKNIDMLKSQLERMICDSTLRNEMSCYSRKFVEIHFSMKAINEEWDKLYSSLYFKNCICLN